MWISLELCRIQLQPGRVELENPKDVLFPEANQLDLRYRPQARARPQAVVSLATTINASDRTYDNLSYLMQSVATLAPALQGAGEIGQLSSLAEVTDTDYDLLYLTAWQALNLEQQELDTLSQYLQTGGVILIEVSTKSAKLAEDIKNLIAYEFEIPWQSWQELSRTHPLRTQPFLFAALPLINQRPIELSNAGGIILVEGDLSAAWGLDNELILERQDIRTAQELGINLLHFAWRRRQMVQWLLEDLGA